MIFSFLISFRAQSNTYGQPEYNFYLSLDRLSGRNDVKSDKANFRPDII